MSKFLEISINLKAEHPFEQILALISDLPFEGIEELPLALNVTFREELFERAKLQELLEPIGLAFTEKVIEQKNWNEEWESGFKPVIIGNYLALRAKFHDVIPGVKYQIVITPKMSFGTGHHATTSLMIRAMAAIDLKYKSVVDLGTGTGVLAILAEKEGAKDIMATDNDPWSIENARENFEENNSGRIILKLSDSLPGLKGVDIILANITLNVLGVLAPGIEQNAKAGTLVLLSGFFEENLGELWTFYHKEKFKLIQQQVEQNWACVLLEKL